MNNKGLFGLAAILSLGLIVVAFIVAHTFIQVKASENIISVTGSADQIITSDTVKWQSNFSRSTGLDNVKEGYPAMKQDLEAVMKYLKQNGVNEKDITMNAVSISPNYSANNYGQSSIIGYTLNQQITVQSSDVDKVTKVAQNSGNLISQGIFFTSNPPEYYYSKLNDIKLDLLAKATQNAKIRAKRIAESTGAVVGKVNSASMGVFQITSVNSTDLSDYGSYDTSSIDKRVMAVVKTSFLVQ